MSGKIRRLESQEKVEGKAVFSGDIKLPEMLICKVLRSETPHARIKSINKEKALSLPGVKAVITAADFPDVKIGFTIQDEVIMARDKVRYIGEALAAVAAVDEETAEKALKLIELDLEELPAILNFEEAIAKEAPLIHENVKEYSSKLPLNKYHNICLHAIIKRGDVEQAFQECDQVFEDTYTMPVVHQAPLETKAAVATVDTRGKLTVWCSTQGPFHIRSGLAATLGLPMSDIRVIGTRVGGAFGGKMQVTVEAIVALMALKTKQPVKIETDRKEEFYSANPRHSMTIYIKTGVKKDGTILARQARLEVDTGAYANFGPHTTSQATLLTTGPYRIPNLFIEGICAYTNKISCGACRGPGAPQTHFAIETQLDKIAEKLGIDSIDLRKKNSLQAKDTTATGQILEDQGYLEVLAELQKQIKEHLAEHLEVQKNKSRGIGVAGCFWGMSGFGSSATLRINEDGTAILAIGAVETGAGSDTAMALLVNKELGIPMEKIRVISGDTDASPFDFGAVGSRTTQAMGVAVIQAVKGVKEQLLALVERQLKIPQEELIFGKEKIYARNNPDQAMSIAMAASILTMVNGGPVLSSGSNTTSNPPFEQAYVESHSLASKPFFVFGAQAVLVEVDKITGKVDVLKVVAVHNVGKAIFKEGVEGQIQGGVAMGLGYALGEEVIFQNGRPINASFLDYRIPTMLDVPQIIPIIVEKKDARIPEDVRGVGEPPVIPTAAAVANAVYHAIGVRFADLPLKPERVFWGIQGK